MLFFSQAEKVLQRHRLQHRVLKAVVPDQPLRVTVSFGFLFFLKKCNVSTNHFFVWFLVPDEILHNDALNECISKLPANYNFEIHKCVWRILRIKAKVVALQFPEGWQAKESVFTLLLFHFFKTNFVKACWRILALLPTFCERLLVWILSLWEMLRMELGKNETETVFLEFFLNNIFFLSSAVLMITPQDHWDAIF